MFTSRDYQSDLDLRAMQDVVIACWRAERPRVFMHIGDLAWWRYQHTGREHEWRIRLWSCGGTVVGWTWLELPATASLVVRPEHREALIPEIVDWLRGQSAGAGAKQLAVGVCDIDLPTHRVLTDLGFRMSDEQAMDALSMSLGGGIAQAPLPDGYRARHVAGEADLANRVAVHRAAWSVRRPSRVTEESYRRVMSAWPYRPELDWVIEAPDGRFVASCLIWLDEANSVGELEPVGTDPAVWRRGFGSAVCRAAIAALRVHGAETAIVYAYEAPGMPPAISLYESLGFRAYAKFVTLACDLG
jgi:GNAT superfamily N-acetyltransferase